jgi:putative PIN family toxin of toxin-antitoxin system
MKVVLDANIFVSSLIWGGKPRKVFDRARRDTDKLYVTEEILAEIANVIYRPKFHAEKSEKDSYMETIRKIGRKVTPQKLTGKGSRDKTDNKYIECAIAGNVDYIISGDIHLLELKQYENIRIVTVGEYLEIAGEVQV